MSIYADILSAYERDKRIREIPKSLNDNVLDFSSNDYMGIAADNGIVRDFLSSQQQVSFTSSASRLLCSQQEEYEKLEDWLGNAYGKAVLLFNSGYHANTGCVSSLAIKGTEIIADKLVHASIIDGLKLSAAGFRRFRHNDIQSLRKELSKVHTTTDTVWVIVESIYSMDGDVAPISEIVKLKNEFPKMRIYVDEAHALGVRGKRGFGMCEELDLISSIDLIVGTFGKAVGSTGAFVATTDELKSFFINNARSFIFSTALPPVNMAFTRFVLNRLSAMSDKRTYLNELSHRLKTGLNSITGQGIVSTSQIVPMMCGCNAKAINYSKALRDADIQALPIRHPTVPAGTERIRFSLSAAMNPQDIDRLLKEVARIYDN